MLKRAMDRWRRTWDGFTGRVKATALGTVLVLIVGWLFREKVDQAGAAVIDWLAASGLVADVVRGLIGPLGLIALVFALLLVLSFWDARRIPEVSPQPLPPVDNASPAAPLTAGTTVVNNLNPPPGSEIILADGTTVRIGPPADATEISPAVASPPPSQAAAAAAGAADSPSPQTPPQTQSAPEEEA